MNNQNKNHTPSYKGDRTGYPWFGASRWEQGGFKDPPRSFYGSAPLSFQQFIRSIPNGDR